MNKRLLREIRHVRLYLVAIALFAAFTGILIVMQAAMLMRIIDGVFLQGQALWQVISFACILLAAVVGRALLIWGNSAVAARAAATVKSSLRQRLFAHLHALGPVALKNERSGEVTMMLVEGVEALDAFFSQMLPQMCAAFFLPTIIGLVVFFTDVLSGVILLVTTPTLFFFMFLIGMMAKVHTQKQWKLLGSMSAHFLDVLQGLTTLKLFGRSRRQQETIARISDRFRETTMGVLRVAFLSSLVMEFGSTISTALVAVEIGLRLLYNQMPFGNAFFVLLLVPDYYLPLRTLGAKFHAAMNSASSAQRIYELLDTPVASQEHSATSSGYVDGQPMPAITLEHVSYAYRDKEGDEHQALRDISLKLESGQSLVLVGASGAGKSTIAQLLLCFIEPQEGAILIGGQPLETIPLDVWRRQVAWIPQRPYLFHQSIANNIRLGCADATMEQVIEAARQAHLHDFILSLPDGYNTMVGERGARLSGGQAQRLALARAFLKDAPLIILDEATAHLDRESEEAVLEALRTLLRDRMALMITHRLHTLRAADRVVMLDEGRVVAGGTHQELLAQSTAYRQLVSSYERKEALWTGPSGVC